MLQRVCIVSISAKYKWRMNKINEVDPDLCTQMLMYGKNDVDSQISSSDLNVFGARGVKELKLTR